SPSTQLAATGTAGPVGAAGTADPPAASTTSDPPGAAGGRHDPLTAAITPGNALGSQGQAKFLYASGSAATEPGQAGTGSGGQDVLIRAGTGYVQNFSLAHGDKLDLTQILAGAPLVHDLANLGNFVRVLGSGSNDPGFGPGTKTSLEI